jgi:hypothetical protein
MLRTLWKKKGFSHKLGILDSLANLTQDALWPPVGVEPCVGSWPDSYLGTD